MSEEVDTAGGGGEQVREGRERLGRGDLVEEDGSRWNLTRLAWNAGLSPPYGRAVASSTTKAR